MFLPAFHSSHLRVEQDCVFQNSESGPTYHPHRGGKLQDTTNSTTRAGPAPIPPCTCSQSPPLPENLPELLEATHQPASDTPTPTPRHLPDSQDFTEHSLPCPVKSPLLLQASTFQEHSLVQPALCSHCPRGFCGGGGVGVASQVTPPRRASCLHRTVTLRAEAELACSPRLDKHQQK